MMSKGRTIRMSWVLAALIAALVLLASCGRREGTVQGTVTQAKDPQQSLEDPANVGQPIADAAVVAYGLEKYKEVSQPVIYRKTVIVYKGRSAADGSFSFGLPPGTYVIEIWVNGLEVSSRQVTVKNGKTSTANYNLKLP